MMHGASAEKPHNRGLNWMWARTKTTTASGPKMTMKPSPTGGRNAPTELGKASFPANSKNLHEEQEEHTQTAALTEGEERSMAEAAWEGRKTRSKMRVNRLSPSYSSSSPSAGSC